MDRLVATGALAVGSTPGLASLGLLGAHEAGLRVSEISAGQRRRLDLALAIASRPHLLLLDEPTNHLSIRLVDELTEALRTTEQPSPSPPTTASCFGIWATGRTSNSAVSGEAVVCTPCAESSV